MAIFIVAILLFSSFVGIGSEEKQNKNPVAIIIASSNIEAIGTAITFDASCSYDPDGDRLHYEWDFGDGSYSNEMIAEHIYRRAGSYTVTLKVEDGRGGIGLNRTDIYIVATSPTICLDDNITEDQKQDREDATMKLYKGIYLAQAFTCNKDILTGVAIKIGKYMIKSFSSKRE